MTDYLKAGVGWPCARQNRGKVEPTRRPCVRERSESASLGVESPTGSGGGGGGRGMQCWLIHEAGAPRGAWRCRAERCRSIPRRAPQPLITDAGDGRHDDLRGADTQPRSHPSRMNLTCITARDRAGSRPFPRPRVRSSAKRAACPALRGTGRRFTDCFSLLFFYRAVLHSPCFVVFPCVVFSVAAVAGTASPLASSLRESLFLPGLRRRACLGRAEKGSAAPHAHH